MNRLVTVFALLAGCGAASAQLADPTRPPADGGQPGAAMPGSTAATGLQTVIIRKGGKPAALINGEVVELGGKVGDSRLIKVSEDAVVLKGPGGEETLRLMPAVQKKMEKVGAGGTAQPARQGGEKEVTR